MKVDPETHRMH